MFHVKLGLVGLVLVLEVWPMITLMRWRIQQGRGETPDLAPMATLARLNTAELLIVLALPFVAAAMARGVGMSLG